MGAHIDCYGCTHRLLWVHTQTVMGAHTDCYGCTHRLLWVHTQTVMGAHIDCYGCMHTWAIMGCSEWTITVLGFLKATYQLKKNIFHPFNTNNQMNICTHIYDH